jgi:hypothetical protein
MKTEKSFRYLWRIMTLAILSSPLTILSPAKAVPPGVPGARCGTLSNPSPGTLCYTVTSGGGKVSAGGSSKDFSTIIQATEPEYVLADVVLEVTSSAGDKSGPTANQISQKGEASVVSIAKDKLRELKQIKGELQAKAQVLAGPALIEAQTKLSALQEQERIYENTVTTTTAAGQDAGKFQITASARSRKCGTLNFDTCGSWVEYNIYAVRRYVGNPIAAYNRAFAVAEDARNTINRLVAQPQPPTSAVCKFENGKTYQAGGGFGGGNRSSDITVVFERTVESNGTLVNLFSGSWRLSDGTSGIEKITLQASSSTFVMIRHMDAGLEQLWMGKCQADNSITGDIWDPTIGSGSFSMKL